MRVETERLFIRYFQKHDYEDAFKYLSDRDVMRYIEPAFNMVQTKGFVDKYGIKERLVFAIEEKTSAKVIGHVIFHKYNDKSEYELGWILNKDFQGKGYAKEASIALCDYGFNKLKLNRIVAETDAKNQRSISLIKSLGMKNSGTCRGKLQIWVLASNDCRAKKLK